MQTPLDLAKHYVAKGYPVFPCRAKPEDVPDPTTGELDTKHEKTPYTSNGLRGASKYARILHRWWGDNPDALVGVPTGAPSGFWVLDLDLKPGVADGHQWLEAMENANGPLPETARAKTANGGTHIFFRHVAGVRNRGGLGSGVDVRGDGGYVIMPGSIMADGRHYKWVSEAPITDAPQWLLDLVLPRPAAQGPAMPFSYQAGTNDHYVNKAVDDELALLATTGQGGRGQQLNASAYALGQFVGAGAISRGEAEQALYAAAQSNGVAQKDGERETWSKIRRGLEAGMRQPRQIPESEFQQDNTRLVDISRMIKNGLEKGRKERAAAVDEDVVREDVSPAGDVEPQDEPDEPENDNAQPASPITATAFKWIDPASLPRREFAYGNHFIRKYVSVTVSPGGLGKTSASIAESLAMASGRALLGTKPPQRLRVWVFNAEDPRDEMERRIMAACIHYNLKPEDIEGHLFLDTGREQELVIAIEDKKAGVKIQEPIVEAVVEQIERHGIDVLIVDPFVSTHGVNENDNGAIDKVAKLWAQVADYTNCAIDIVHHLRKVADREATVEDARGAVSLIGAARSVRVLNRMSEEQASQAGVPPEDRFGYFFTTYGKSNLTPLSHKAEWRHLVGVPLGNGRGLTKPQDFAPVVTEWKWPSREEIAESIPADIRRAIVIKFGNQSYRESSQSEDWAGYALAALMSEPVDVTKAMTAEKKKVKAMLDALISDGTLAVVDEPDPKHIDRKIKFIRPAEMA
ncbi:bifunctional DNA primase/polymerase [Rhizobium sp. CBN3]|uniref:bifunctional DNA primase/polymerase n=1 Tax=Rhizobium sp. CBN3 TaxID=3058045 RepID=UPI0026716D37|nr:bifunctional DNA primase/polymerase [Rhizobium sp. CBN3]MDO3431172.1 bifunctional DNA primase/polymerase [Rhizobium sp. CBN3]